MSDLPLDLGDWVDAASDALVESAEALLGMETKLAASSTTYPTLGADRWGVLLPFSAEGYSLHVGLISTTAGCKALTDAMLGPDDWSEDEVADAVGEVVNVMAGMMHGDLLHRDETIDFGLPVVMQAHLFDGHSSESTVLAAGIGGIEFDLILMMTALQPGKVC